MELSLLRHTNMDATGTIRHPGTILFPAKESAWQPVVAPLSVLQQNIPKESIIANTDFTTTSVIAKRRLSSKKRKKQLDQSSGNCDSPSDDSKSPRDQSSPAVSSAHLSPTDSHLNLKSTSSSSSVSSSFRPPPVDLSASSYPSSQSVASTATQYVALGNHGLHVAQPQPTQVLSSLPPEMAHQLIHKQQTLMAGQVSVPHFVPVQFPAHPQGSDPALNKEADREMAFGSLQSGESNQGFHWCSAHVLIAQKIRSHQLQLREQENSRVTQHNLIPAPSSVPSSQACHIQAQQAQLEAIQQHIHCQQQIQQQMALLQLYGCVPTVHGVMAAVAPDQLQVHGALPGHPTHQPHPQASQLLGIHLPAVYPTQGVPMAALAHNDMSSAMTTTTLVQGQNGSWLTPAVPVIGSCIVNPLQPGMLATSWVK